MQSEVVLFQILYTPVLPHVEVLLSKNVLQTFVVQKHLELFTVKIVALSLQGKDNGLELHVMCGVILLVILQLPRTISHHPPGLH